MRYIYILTTLLFASFISCSDDSTEIIEEDMQQVDPNDETNNDTDSGDNNTELSFFDTDLFKKANLELGTYTTSLSKNPPLVYDVELKELEYSITYILQGEAIEKITSPYEETICGEDSCNFIFLRSYTDSNDEVQYEFNIRLNFFDFPIENNYSWMGSDYSTSMELISTDSTEDTCEVCTVSIYEYPFDIKEINLPNVKVNFSKTETSFSLKVEDNHGTDNGEFVTHIDVTDIPLEQWRTIFDGINTVILFRDAYTLTYQNATSGSVLFQ